MKRRSFIALAGAAVAFPRVAFAQQTAKVPRIAFLWSASVLPEWIQAYQQGLADFGYVDGKTITTEAFAAQNNVDMPAAAAKAVASKPDVIVTHGSVGAAAAKAATTTIPIVFGVTIDPVAEGLVASLAHPGSNATGTTNASPDLVGKQLGIMKEIIPTMKRIVALSVKDGAAGALIMAQVAPAAKALDIEFVIVDFVQGPDFTTQFDRVVAAAPQAIYVPASTYFSANRDLLVDLQIKYRIPLLWPSPTTAPRAMVGYGSTTITTIRETVAYVAAILKGAKPSDLPVHQPTKFDLAINLATAKALGITIPTSILAQATIVIE